MRNKRTLFRNSIEVAKNFPSSLGVSDFVLGTTKYRQNKSKEGALKLSD